jgi:uncharacterized membrane protein YeiH
MFSSYRYLLLAALCALVVFSVARGFGTRYLANRERLDQINNIFDAVGLGVFAVSGARIAVEAGYIGNPFLTVFLGMTTAVGGGIFRDMLIREVPFVLKKRVYAIAAITGALAYWLCLRAGALEPAAAFIGLTLTFVLRMVATHFRWNLPRAIP